MNGYKELANAIIIQAVKDYRKALKPDDRRCKCYKQERKREVEEFFRSEWFTVLTNISGEMIIRKLRVEVKE